jgi:hypothetical protein
MADGIWKKYGAGKFIDDVRAAIVGIAVGWGTVAFAFPTVIEHFVKTNSAGYAQPLLSLTEQLAVDEAPATVRFDPPTLDKMYVCESAYVSGETNRQIFLSYIDRYPMCFDLGEEDKAKYVVRLNRTSAAVSEKNGEFFCKCPS